MIRRLRPLFASLTATLPLACDETPDLPVDDVEDIELREGAGQGGPLFNTPVMKTSSIAAVDTRGRLLNGVKLVDVELLGVSGYFSIDPGTLNADHGTVEALLLSNVVDGEDFLDSRWTFDVGGDEITAYITDIETSAAAGLYNPASTSDLRKLDPERLVYTFQWEDAVEALYDVCVADATGGSRMVIYDDIVVDHKSGDISVRADTLYFGCISGAVGKAALWGYAWDSPSLTSVTLPAFETAVRLVRDDFCGDGVAHTVVGQPVILRDRWSVNAFPNLPAFTTEAVWEAGGAARCMRRIRSTGVTLIAPFQCPDSHVIPLCTGDSALESSFTNHGYGDIWSKIF